MSEIVTVASIIGRDPITLAEAKFRLRQAGYTEAEARDAILLGMDSGELEWMPDRRIRAAEGWA